MLRDGIPFGRYMMNALEVTVAKDQVEAACLGIELIHDSHDKCKLM